MKNARPNGRKSSGSAASAVRKKLRSLRATGRAEPLCIRSGTEAGRERHDASASSIAATCNAERTPKTNVQDELFRAVCSAHFSPLLVLHKLSKLSLEVTNELAKWNQAFIGIPQNIRTSVEKRKLLDCEWQK